MMMLLHQHFILMQTKYLIQHLKSSEKNPIIIGLLWDQWETEVLTGRDVSKRAYTNYETLFNGFFDTIGTSDIPTFL